MDTSSEFFAEIEGMGLDRDVVSTALLKLYIAGGEMPFRRGSEKPVMLPLWEHPKWVVELLDRYKLLDYFAHGSRENRTYYYKLTEKGWEIAQKVFQQFLKIKKEEIETVLRGFPRKLLCLAVIGCSKGLGLLYKAQGMRTASARELSELLHTTELNIALSEFDDTILDVVGRIGFKEALEQIRDRELSIICKNYLIVFAQFMVQYPLVRQRVEDLFEVLTSKGIAIKVPEYNSKGYYVSEVCKAPLEVGYEILHLCKTDMSTELNRFVEISVFLRAFWRDFTKGRLELFLKALGLSELAVDAMLNVMAEEGTTSRYNKLGNDNSLPFTILDDEDYSKHIDQALKMLANSILGD